MIENRSSNRFANVALTTAVVVLGVLLIAVIVLVTARAKRRLSPDPSGTGYAGGGFSTRCAFMAAM